MSACGGGQRATYRLRATAEDRGYPPLSRSVDVQIDVVDRGSNPPVWGQIVYGPIYVPENMAVGSSVIQAKARSAARADGRPGAACHAPDARFACTLQCA